MSLADKLKAFGHRLEGPLSTLAAHFVFTICLISAVAGVERLMEFFSLYKQSVPFVGKPLADLVFFLDAVFACGAMGVGTIKGLKELWDNNDDTD